MRSVWLVGALALCVVASCASETKRDPVGPWESLDERYCPPDSSLSWENFGDPFFRNWCNGCHLSSIPEDDRREAPIETYFDTLHDVRAQKDIIWEQAGDSNDEMPPVGGPPAEERALLGEWLACGAPREHDLR